MGLNLLTKQLGFFSVALLLSTVSFAAKAEDGPRTGKYTIQVYNPRAFRVGSVELLAGNKYKTQSGGEGTYTYAAGNITWTSGTYKDQGLLGEFTTTREGKTHRIVLKKTAGGKDSMIAFCSID